MGKPAEHPLLQVLVLIVYYADLLLIVTYNVLQQGDDFRPIVSFLAVSRTCSVAHPTTSINIIARVPTEENSCRNTQYGTTYNGRAHTL